MKYKLIGESDIFNPIKTVFNNRNITDYNAFINLPESVTHDWRLLKNIDSAIQLLVQHIKLNSNIFIQIDEDTDGYLSAATLYNYLHRLKPDINIQWRTHDTKKHGIIPSTVPDNIDLLIIPDASSNEYEKHKELQDRGKDIIILDHHEAPKESEFAIVVNNQLSPNYPNKEFSACGIVYKFCKALDEHYEVNYADEYLDLVAIGNIADSMSTREYETRYYIQEGLKRVKNPLIEAIVKHNSYTLNNKVNIKGVSWTIAPTINAVTRIGTIEERQNLFRALTYQVDEIDVKPKNDSETVYEAVARILSNTRGRQNTLREKGERAVVERIEEKNIDENKIIIVNATDIVEPSLSGVVAIRIAEKYKRPALIIRQNKDGSKFSGSARGYDKGEIQDLKQFLNDTDKFIFCEGHPMAFGISIETNQLVPIRDVVNEKLKGMEIGQDIYHVDFVVPAKQLQKSFVAEIAKYEDIWGKDVEEPLVFISSISLNKTDLLLQGKNKNVIKFKHNNIEFIKFRASEDEYNSIVEQVGDGDTLVLNVVGRCGVNEWRGRVTPQIIIEDYEVAEVKKKELVF